MPLVPARTGCRLEPSFRGTKAPRATCWSSGGANQRSVTHHSHANGGSRLRSRPEQRLTALLSEDQPRRVLVDVFDRLVELGERAAAVNGEGLEFLEAGIGKTGEPDRNLVGALVEIFRELAHRLRRLGDLAAFVAAAGKVFEAGHHLVEALRVLRQRRGHRLDVAKRAAQRRL